MSATFTDSRIYFSAWGTAVDGNAAATQSLPECRTPWYIADMGSLK
ncbi:MAG TPA: hypothetical protein VG099_23360 [Gemmataceae bacterium]|jgi:hypothetical protein|nr:hypothetical protein [Gemmataceae bacterium]